MIGEEVPVQFSALLFQYPHRNFYTSLAQYLNALATHLGKGVYAAHHTAAHPLGHYQVGTGRCFAVVGTRLQTYVDGGLRQQCLVGSTDRGKGIHLSMSLSAAHMIALADDAPVGGHYHGTHHGIGLCLLCSVACQLQAPCHVSLVGSEHGCWHLQVSQSL